MMRRRTDTTTLESLIVSTKMPLDIFHHMIHNKFFVGVLKLDIFSYINHKGYLQQ